MLKADVIVREQAGEVEKTKAELAQPDPSSADADLIMQKLAGPSPSGVKGE